MKVGFCGGICRWPNSQKPPSEMAKLLVDFCWP